MIGRIIFILLFMGASRFLPDQQGAAILSSPNLIYGFPGSHGRMLDRTYYIVSYDTVAKVPEWTAYRLLKVNLNGPIKRTDDFRPDPDLIATERSELRDYESNGYDRGHSAPAQDFAWSLNAMSSTFLLSNMSPQHPSLNRGKWSALENNVRQVAEKFDTCWVITGSVFRQSASKHKTLGVERSGWQRKIGEDSVWVPTHLYKIVLAHDTDGSILMWAFLMEHRNVKLPGKVVDYSVSVDSIETLTGLDFFKDLPDSLEHRLEASANYVWPVK